MNPIEKTLERHKKANKKIEAAAANMRKLYRDARLTINDKIQKAVMRSNDPLAGKGLIQLIESLSGAYGELEQSFREEFDRAIPYVAEAYAHDALKDLGETILGKVDKNRIELFRRDAFTHIAGATTAMEKTDVAFLRQASADVFREAALTGITRKEASKNLLGQLMSRPDQFRFTDAAGKVWNNETYCDMLGRTVLLNVGRQTYLDTCADQGKDVVRVTVSGNPCPDCAVWENRLLSLTGATEGLPTVDEASAAGLFHPNCTHSLVAVGDYVQKKQFDEDGRPKSGLNAEGNEQTSEPEDWTAYRKEIWNNNLFALRENLTKEEAEAVNYYTGSDHLELNRYIANAKTGNAQLESKINELSSAIDKSVTKKDMTVWRGIGSPRIRAKYEKDPLSSIDITSFQSCSKDRDIAKGFADGNILMKIHIPRGAHALNASDNSKFKGEKEILLKPVGKYNIRRQYYDQDGHLVMEVDYVEH